MSPLLKTGSLTPSPHVAFLRFSPLSSGDTSFMDVPLCENLIFKYKMMKAIFKSLGNKKFLNIRS